MKYPNLFSPVTLGGVRLRNKLFMSMGNMMLAENGRGFTQKYIDYFTERAKNGVGLLMTGHVKMESKLDPCPITAPSLDQDFKLFSELCEQVHSYGAKIAIQINPGAGRLCDVFDGVYEPAAASEGPCLYYPAVKTRALTKEEIKERVQIFGQAAATAKAAGFDIIVVNTQAYLNDQFLTPAWNQRTDEYGGSLENRLRFIMEQIDAVRATCGPRMPIIANVSMDQGIEGGKTVEDWIGICKAFEEKGLAAVFLRNGSYDSGEFNSDSMTHSYMRPGLASIANVDKVRPHVNIPIITDGSFRTPEQAEEILAEGRAYMVGACRALLADEEWAIKAMEGRAEDIRPCLRCNECMSRYVEGRFPGCSVNPLAFHEGEAYRYHKPADKVKKVLVIGGGLGGMRSAIYAARRGHDVTIVEKADKLGGKMLQASANKDKEEYRSYVAWVQRELDKAGVKVITGVTADKAYVDEFQPDEIIVGTGTIPTVPPIPGIDGANVKSCYDVLLDHSLVGDNVVVLGGGFVGCETALDLAYDGKKVTIVEMRPEVGADIAVMMKYPIIVKMATLGVVSMGGAATKEITADGIRVVDAEGNEQFIECDNIVTATGRVTDDSLYCELVSEYPHVHMIGDSFAPGKFIDVGRAAYNIGNNI